MFKFFLVGALFGAVCMALFWVLCRIFGERLLRQTNVQEECAAPEGRWNPTKNDRTIL